MLYAFPPSPPAFVAAAPAAAKRTIPAGTVIAVALSETVDSGKAKAGEFFRFETMEPLTIDGRTVLPAHTPGLGIVSDAQAAGAHSRPGSLLLEARYLRLPGGGELQVTVDRKVADLRQHGVSPALPFYTSYLPIPAMGLLTSAYKYLLNGKNVELEKGTVFIVVTIQTARL
ncbi:MAG TPA: hypothetical protein VNJ51_04170 [Candidatus Dormibacteraeota bacterium]|nr:hypothetical protein [Candidatus Dormibacteraeota bacterium]